MQTVDEGSFYLATSDAAGHDEKLTIVDGAMVCAHVPACHVRAEMPLSMVGCVCCAAPSPGLPLLPCMEVLMPRLGSPHALLCGEGSHRTRLTVELLLSGTWQLSQLQSSHSGNHPTAQQSHCVAVAPSLTATRAVGG